MSLPYRTSAELYDGIYSGKKYGEEAEALRGLIERARPGARTLLDVGCGTGAHLEQLKRWYQVEGLDLSEGMIEVARRRLPGTGLHVGDMRAFQLGRRFDVVTCLFSAIGYVKSVEEMAAAVAAMAGHLEPGGLLAIEPWFTPAQWKPGTKVHGGLEVDRDDCKVSRFVVTHTRGRFAVMPMHHLVGTLQGVEHFVETHEMLLMEESEMRGAFEAAGLKEVRFEPGVLVRGLWLGTR